MKFNIPIEVNGIKRIVVGQEKVYTRYTAQDGKLYWLGPKGKPIKDAHMCARIQRMLHKDVRISIERPRYSRCTNKIKVKVETDHIPKYRAWVHCETLNIDYNMV